MQNTVDFPSQARRETSYSPSSKAYVFDLGETLFRAGSFKKCIPCFKEVRGHLLELENFSALMDCYAMLMQALFEQNELEELKTIKKEFDSICERHHLTKTAKSLIVQSYYASVLQPTSSNSEDYLRQALDQVLSKEASTRDSGDRIQEFKAKIEVIYCLYAYSAYYYSSKQHDKCRQELGNLRVLLEYYFNLQSQLLEERSKTDDVQKQKFYEKLSKLIEKEYSFVRRIELSVLFIQACIETDSDKADKMLWQAYELANTHGNTYMIPYVLAQMSSNNLKRGELDQASIFFNLAKRHLDQENFKLFSKKVRVIEARIQEEAKKKSLTNYDLVFNSKNKSIIERDKGLVNFKNQFILWDILDLFVSNPGQAYSKQKLVELIWNQEYSPLVHDNKIYVTIKRLRELVEPESNKPKYIFRSKEGYYLREDAQVLVS